MKENDLSQLMDNLFSLNKQNKFNLRDTHISLFMSLIYLSNFSFGWFKSTPEYAMLGAAIKTKRTYYKTLKDLVKYGMVEYQPGKNKNTLPSLKINNLSPI